MVKQPAKELFEIISSPAGVPDQGLRPLTARPRTRAGRREAGMPIVIFSDEPFVREDSTVSSAAANSRAAAAGSRNAGKPSRPRDLSRKASGRRFVALEKPARPKSAKKAAIESPRNPHRKQAVKAQAEGVAPARGLPRIMPVASSSSHDTKKTSRRGAISKGSLRIPRNEKADSASSWVGEIALWGSHSVQLRRDTLAVALAIILAAIFLSFLLGQKMAGKTSAESSEYPTRLDTSLAQTTTFPGGSGSAPSDGQLII